VATNGLSGLFGDQYVRPSAGACHVIGRNIPGRIKLKVGTKFCDKKGQNQARVVKIMNRYVRFSDNGDLKTCKQGDLCAFAWPSSPLFRVEARSDPVKGIKPRAAMLPR
jgi:hypothetical protein